MTLGMFVKIPTTSVLVGLMFCNTAGPPLFPPCNAQFFASMAVTLKVL